MKDAADWVLNLVDKVTGPARRIMKSLGGVTETVTHLFTLWTGLEAVMSGRFFESVSAGVHALTGKLKLFALQGAAAATVGLGWSYMLTKSVVDMGIYADSSTLAMQALTGSTTKGKEAFSNATKLAKELGLGVEETVDHYKKLLAMQFKVEEASDLVKIAADLRKVSGDAHGAERALLAITQVKAKGRLQQEELMQLAEAGLSEMLVYREIGKLKNQTDITKIRKMISDGQVDSDTGINAIKRAVMAKVHETSPGQAAKRYADTTFAGLLGQLQAAPGQLFLRVYQAAETEVAKLRPLIKEIIATIEAVDVSTLADFVGKMLQFATRAVLLGKEFVLSFMKGSKAITDVMEGFAAGKNAVDVARRLGESAAKAVALGIWVVGQLAGIMVWINDHRWVIWLYLAQAAFWKLFAIATSLVHAYFMITTFIWLWRLASMGSLVAEGAQLTGMFAIWAKRMPWLQGALTMMQGQLLKFMPWLRGAIMAVGRVLLQQFVLIPLAVTGVLAAVIGALVLVWVYWDEINAEIEKVVFNIGKMWDAIVGIAGLIADPSMWNEAGAEAGWNFGMAFLEAFWNVFKWTPMGQPIWALVEGYKWAKGEEAEPPDNSKYFAINDADFQKSQIQTRPSDMLDMHNKSQAEVAALLKQQAAEPGRRGGDMELHVHVQSDSSDPKAHGQVAGDVVRDNLAAWWRGGAAEVGAGT